MLFAMNDRTRLVTSTHKPCVSCLQTLFSWTSLANFRIEIARMGLALRLTEGSITDTVRVCICKKMGIWDYCLLHLLTLLVFLGYLLCYIDNMNHVVWFMAHCLVFKFPLMVIGHSAKRAWCHVFMHQYLWTYYFWSILTILT